MKSQIISQSPLSQPGQQETLSNRSCWSILKQLYSRMIELNRARTLHHQMPLTLHLSSSLSSHASHSCHWQLVTLVLELCTVCFTSSSLLSRPSHASVTDSLLYVVFLVIMQLTAVTDSLFYIVFLVITQLTVVTGMTACFTSSSLWSSSSQLSQEWQLVLHRLPRDHAAHSCYRNSSVENNWLTNEKYVCLNNVL